MQHLSRMCNGFHWRVGHKTEQLTAEEREMREHSHRWFSDHWVVNLAKEKKTYKATNVLTGWSPSIFLIPNFDLRQGHWHAGIYRNKMLLMQFQNVVPLQWEGARVLYHITCKSYAEILGLMDTVQYKKVEVLPSVSGCASGHWNPLSTCKYKYLPQNEKTPIFHFQFLYHQIC